MYHQARVLQNKGDKDKAKELLLSLKERLNKNDDPIATGLPPPPTYPYLKEVRDGPPSRARPDRRPEAQREGRPRRAWRRRGPESRADQEDDGRHEEERGALRGVSARLLLLAAIAVRRRGAAWATCLPATGSIRRCRPGTTDRAERCTSSFTARWRPRVARPARTGSAGGPEIDPEHNRVFVGTSDHGLYALRAGDGSTLWRYETMGLVQSEPLLQRRAGLCLLRLERRSPLPASVRRQGSSSFATTRVPRSHGSPSSQARRSCSRTPRTTCSVPTGGRARPCGKSGARRRSGWRSAGTPDPPMIRGTGSSTWPTPTATSSRTTAATAPKNGRRWTSPQSPSRPAGKRRATSTSTRRPSSTSFPGRGRRTAGTSSTCRATPAGSTRSMRTPGRASGRTTR